MTWSQAQKEARPPNHLIKDFLRMHSLTAPSTYFMKPSYNTWAFGSSHEEKTRQIDHFIVRQADRKRVWNCEVNDATGVMSDHHSIMMTLQLTNYVPQKNRRTKRQPPTANTDETEQPTKRPQIDWPSIREPAENEGEPTRETLFNEH